MVEKTSIGEVIEDTIDLRKVYEEKLPKYQRLLKAVQLILNTAIEKNNIKIHSMAARVKDYSGFLEKVERKRYKDPFMECTDIAGCRIICLFQSQVEEIKNIIKNELEVVEITDKMSLKKYDQFGYLSLHMLIKIPKNRCGFVEYEGLDDFVCELQIRTILQEAWAEIEHYLNYKSTKEEKNQELLRKIFSLAGMFEVADSTFEEIHTGFSRLIETKLPEDLQNITALNLYKFSKEYFAWYKNSWDKKEERSFVKLSNEVKRINLKSISQIKSLLAKYKKELGSYETYYKQKDERESRYFTPVGLIRAALALEYGKKFDLVFGLKGYSEKIAKETKDQVD